MTKKDFKNYNSLALSIKDVKLSARTLGDAAENSKSFGYERTPTIDFIEEDVQTKS
jgi:hypothetical protein